jgi:hypothetical protein
MALLGLPDQATAKAGFTQLISGARYGTAAEVAEVVDDLLSPESGPLRTPLETDSDGGCHADRVELSRRSLRSADGAWPKWVTTVRVIWLWSAKPAALATLARSSSPSAIRSRA